MHSTTIVKTRKLKWWYGHVFRPSGLAETTLQGTMKGGRRQGTLKKRWKDSTRDWTGLEFAKFQRAVQNREKWRKLVVKSSVVPQRPPRSYWCGPFTEFCSSQRQMWWSGVVGVAGTQRRTQANERPQQAAYNSNNILFLQTKPARRQRTHTVKHTQWARAAKKASKRCKSIRSSKQPNKQNVCFLGPLQLEISLQFRTS